MFLGIASSFIEKMKKQRLKGKPSYHFYDSLVFVFMFSTKAMASTVFNSDILYRDIIPINIVAFLPINIRNRCLFDCQI